MNRNAGPEVSRRSWSEHLPTFASALSARSSSARQKLKWPSGDCTARLLAMMSCFTGGTGTHAASSVAAAVSAGDTMPAGSVSAFNGTAASCRVAVVSLINSTHDCSGLQVMHLHDVVICAPVAAHEHEPAARHVESHSPPGDSCHAAPSAPLHTSPRPVPPSLCCPGCRLQAKSTVASPPQVP